MDSNEDKKATKQEAAKEKAAKKAAAKAKAASKKRAAANAIANAAQNAANAAQHAALAAANAALGGDLMPLPSFFFNVEILGFPPFDYGFQDVEGLGVTREIKEIPSGGLHYNYRVPGKIQYGKLVLKRGIVDPLSLLSTWCKTSIMTDFSTPIVPKDINVQLLMQVGVPSMVWNFKNAWPESWEYSNLKSTDSGILIESLTLVYESFSRTL